MQYQLLVVAALASSALATNGQGAAHIVMSPEAAKDAEDEMRAALQEEAPLLKEVRAEPKSSRQHKSEEFEKDVTDMIMGLSKADFGATPMGSSVTVIKDLIEKDMLGRVIKAHASNQDDLNKASAQTKACGTTKTSQLATAAKISVTYKAKSTLHKKCRQSENDLYVENVACHKEWLSRKQIKELKCKAYSDVSMRVGNQNSNKQIVTKGGSEIIEAYVKRVTSTICGLPGGGGNGGHGKTGFLDDLLNAKEACEKATREFNAKDKECKKLHLDWKNKKKECNDLQDAMDDSSCKAAIGAKDACESYAECYTSKKDAYDNLEKMVKQEEIDRKGEWKGLKRMQCLIVAFADGKVEESEVVACKDKTHTTDHLTIKYPGIPSLASCAIPDLYPTTGAYKKQEFQPLPQFAKGKLEANECTGLSVISTSPRTGSPASCKCERVALSGPYSAGGMVSCVNCMDVRRASEKNSCPDGTKLFAPQSRSDWDTFIKSAKPLRAPNWIVDVTRPQNGCGGCVNHAFNSDTKQQASWQTSDKSPWWLRSSKYNEPNGDYHANCYLDLWQTPKNADSVTWNDGSCSYHSKSYYCQAAKISTTPKAGSPSGCVCNKVELSGKYSARVLLRCENCLDVYRANDKNSCPIGTKIFAPASREDWKTFIASAKSLRNPHWIIDVTRPQNGCGGCTGHAMNSAVAAQATWQTADGSPWWLRSTRYNEPNGDYHANCYLDLWQSPANENAVTWNDGSCSYHSKSYYCQNVKKAAPVTSTAPPWSAAQKAAIPVTFKDSAAWVAPRSGTIEVLIVSGGAGGGGRSGGGGGGGSVLTHSTYTVTAKKSYQVKIGAGGTGGSGSGAKGNNGGDSSFDSLVVKGGGGGASDAHQAGYEGGNGGGGKYGKAGGNAAAQKAAAGATIHGNKGGSGTHGTWNGGGGGGAGALGLSGTSTNCGNGGQGLKSCISGVCAHYGAGGGGGSHNPKCHRDSGTGGMGGGGSGGSYATKNDQTNQPGSNGVDGLGGGGGGGSTDSSVGGAGGKGGKGIVIIRYTAR